MPRATDADLDLLFRNARSHNGWTDRPVTDAQLREIYDVVKFGPTSANSSPARILFLRTPESKERLRPALSSTIINKVMTAPVTAIIGYDLTFYEHLPRLFAHNQTARSWFAGDQNKAVAEITAIRNGTLQGAYFIIVARALGLDCAPMSGFDNARVDAEFFAGTTIRSNFICSIGHGDQSKIIPRNERLAFEEACTLM